MRCAGLFLPAGIYCGSVTKWSRRTALRRGGGSIRRNGSAQQPFHRAMAEQNDKSFLERIGCRVSEFVADVAGHPFAQLGFVVVCVAWFAVGWNVNIFTAGLSILAITLTQMVLNRQNEREIEDHRRDVAMHAKLDELISASRRAKNEFVGIEEREEEEIVQLKEEVKEAIEQSPATEDPKSKEVAKRAVERAAEEVKQKTDKAKTGSRTRKRAAKG